MTLNILSQKNIDAAIANVMPDIPDGHTHAIVLGVDDQGAKFAATFKSIDGIWKAQAYAEHDWNGDNTVGARLLMSF